MALATVTLLQFQSRALGLSFLSLFTLDIKVTKSINSSTVGLYKHSNSLFHEYK